MVRKKTEKLKLQPLPCRYLESKQQDRSVECALKAAEYRQFWGMESKYLYLTNFALLIITLSQVRINICFLYAILKTVVSFVNGGAKGIISSYGYTLKAHYFSAFKHLCFFLHHCHVMQLYIVD